MPKFDVPEDKLANAEWRSASGGPGDGNQVEVARVGEGYAMRNSDHPDGPILLFTKAEWDAFILGARDGEFDV
jgi:hypothetical protein